jgi:transcriptional regulator with XRE-family HTH domain
VPLPNDIAAELSRFGANIRRERIARSVTQEKLAERADLNVRTLQKIEASQLNVLITTAARFQRALGCSWEKLMPIRQRVTKPHS